ncbi:Na+-dependent transporters of the SNF family [Anaerobiospirillum thomasii]|uniref:Transporter n=1 Tax=Anaerobiospirillum thomasii TaxID=179995 RepID=A0A2X0VM27_9GAMM|nr:sodium-dependent transporter [Anaerobiospirillum thomasii]SPT68584.1 Na+-dependent transporters of the SNF family [Anaerobiospirillum thomasii]SPT68780.1 Na+-dependent transporters of the SNF family [Anaerobiospirillum thomasii]
MPTREHFSSRLGFLLIAAGCAIGLGNVWRFPFITGQYGGALFVLIYVFFLLAFGVPLLSMELAIGRASRRSLAQSFEVLTPKSKIWRLNKFWMIAGNYVLMSFYSVVTGWMLFYCIKGFTGEFGVNTSAADAGKAFGDMLASPSSMLINMIAVVSVGFGICALGLRKGVERVTKPLMLLLFALLIFLSLRSFTLDGFKEGIEYYLYPNFESIEKYGILQILSAAMAQAFFTLSIGIGAIQIFGTYMDSRYSLATEAVTITLLDTTVALLSGLIIFPACFTYGVQPNEGPGLIFVTLVSIFSNMENGSIWGGFFFMFMLFAALSTLIAVFENIIAITMELFTTSRRRSVMVNFAVILVLALPCLFGFNLLSDVHPLGGNSTFLDLEDFIISNNILPLGALCYVAYITWRGGWGFENYRKEANTGNGFKIPAWGINYYRFLLPVVIIFLIVNSYMSVFGK